MAAKKRKPHAKDWRARDISDWNATTFRAYLEEKHMERFGVPYARRCPIAAEAAMIKRMIDEHGPETVRAFIDECFKQYKPNSRYPGVNFAFMQTYMSDCLQRVLKQKAREERRKEREARQESQDLREILEWL